MVQLHENGQLFFINSVNDNGNAYFHTAVDTNKWYEIEIEQTRIGGKVEKMLVRTSYHILNHDIFLGILHGQNW